MSENNLNKKYFTEQDSPIQLIPTDVAWENMQEKLNNEQPEKRKRRFFFWIPPVGCAAFVLLLLAGGMAIWWPYNKNKTALQEQSALSKSVQLTDSLQIRNQQTANNNNTYNNNDNPKLTTVTNDTQQLSVTTQTPVVSIKQTPAQKPTLTAYYRSGATKTAAKEQQQFVHKNRNNAPTLPVDENNSGTAFTRDLPIANPQLAALPGMAIAVTTNQPLPGVAFAGNKLPHSNRNKPVVVSAGLQWQAPVPFSGMNDYFKGPNGKDQPYRLLIPGLWLSAAKNRHRLVASFMPFMNADLPNKYYQKDSMLSGTNDSITGYKRMVKTFGLQAGIHYNYQINAHWYVGAGLDANWWKKGLVWLKPADDSTGTTKPFYYTTDPQREKRLNPFQVSMVIETGYRLNAWEGILQVSRPWKATVKDLAPPVWLRLGIRYRLFQKNIGR